MTCGSAKSDRLKTCQRVKNNDEFVKTFLGRLNLFKMHFNASNDQILKKGYKVLVVFFL